MNKVYSRVFLSALGSRLLGYSLSVHVPTLWWWDLLKYTHLLVCTVSVLTQTRRWGGEDDTWIERGKQTRTTQTVEGQTGGEDGYLSAGGLSSLLYSRVLQELTCSSSPACYPLPASAVKCAEMTALVSAHEGRGWIFCPWICLHECLLSSPQQIVYNPSASLEKLI